MTYDVRNPVTGLGQSQKYGGVKPIFISFTGTKCTVKLYNSFYVSLFTLENSLTKMNSVNNI